MCEAKARVETLEAERQELLDRTAEPPAGFDFADANRRLAALQAEIDERTAAWEEHVSALEEEQAAQKL